MVLFTDTLDMYEKLSHDLSPYNLATICYVPTESQLRFVQVKFP